MKISQIISTIEKVAPKALQESYDNAGVQVGHTDSTLTKALICLDITEEVVDEAIALGANLVIAHHPLIFKPLKSLTGKNYIERCVIKAISNNICLYAAHTNLDNCATGVNFKIAEKLGLGNLSILAPKENALLKLSVFVPTDHADNLRETLTGAGAGNIGNYDSCSYNSDGFGTFRAKDGANPFCGELGKLHRGNEMKIEVILPSFLRNKVENALRKSHPYEEPAFEFTPILNEWSSAGAGMVGELPEAMDALEFLKMVKETFGVGCIKYAGKTDKPVKRVAFCGGSGAEFIYDALNADADIYITGEIKYHDFFGVDRQMLLAEIGHYESEQFTSELIAEIVKQAHPEFEYSITKTITNPIKYL